MLQYNIRKTSRGLALAEESFNRKFLSKTETVFAQCNGYLGIRAAFETKALGETRGAFVGGFYHSASEDEVTELVNCPDVTEFELTAEGEEISLDLCEILEFERLLYLDTGALQIHVKLKTPGGLIVCLDSRRFVSRENKHMLAHELAVRLDGERRLTVSTGINGQMTNSGVSHFAKVQARVFDKKYLYTENTCDDRQQLLVMCTTEADQEPERVDFVLKRRSVYETKQFFLPAGETLRLVKYSYYENVRSTAGPVSGCSKAAQPAQRETDRAAGDRTREPEETKRMETMQNALKNAAENGYDRLFDAHCAACETLLKYARISIEGASLEEEACIAFAIYHLLGMTPQDTDEYSVAAKGLTGEGYKGHVFWDTELFVQPYFTGLFPDIAKNLLSFRYRGLAGARKKAERYGYEGAMYPWEAAATGEEETPLYAALNIHTGKAAKVWSGIKEHHVTADIIYALWDYYKLTKDEAFLLEKGYEMLAETAMFWYTRSTYSKEKACYEILDIIGPDEYTEHVDNNAYTNYMAWFNVALASSELIKLEKKNPEKYQELLRRYDLAGWQEKWKDFLEKLYLPKENADGIIPQDDTFLRKKQLPHIDVYKSSDVKQAVLLDFSREEVVDMQVLKQADTVMLLNLMPSLFSPETVRKNVLFYEERTIHDSSLSYCAHAIACAKIGDLVPARRFFEKAMEIDLDTNPKDSRDGIHSGSLGGVLNCLIQGFAGVEHEQGSILIRPHLPREWGKMEFYHMAGGTYYRICISNDGVTALREGTQEAVSLTQENGGYRLRF